MLAYAPQRRDAGAGQSSRKTLLFVVVGHVALVAVALTTKMTIDQVIKEPPITVETYKNPPPLDPVEVEPVKPVETTASQVTAVKPIVPVDIPLNPVEAQPGPSIPSGPVAGTSTLPQPPVIEPVHDPVRTGPVLRTADNDLRPPYPTDKLRAEEEATLKLHLTIDDKGRVIAVDPVGKADPSFLQAARRHLIRSWRYKPATVDGVATGTTMVISLSFRLEDA